MTSSSDRDMAVKGNVDHVLTSSGWRSDTALIQGALNYVLTGTPTNFVAAHKARLVPEERQVLAALCLAVDASLDGETPLGDSRTRLSKVRTELVEVDAWS